ncbi:MAG: molecular chaperone HtpG [Candidatus Lambdaproteobacteria bacterium]|nr:molecular chaperone HtpG [Candidatus Lambdaproteobacteria bacterium]
MTESSSERPKDAAASPATGEVHRFQAEMQQLLRIIIHSLYSEREIFLRELISNASDALNRLRYLMHTQPEVRDKDAALEIAIEVDGPGKAITIRDTGIGMSREDLIANLGTIARSGTLEFVQQLSAADAGRRAELIGQFGVGFYAVFMVARRVVVDSCPADPAQGAWQWSSEGAGEFTLLPSQRQRRGTAIRVELKEDAEEFRNPLRLETIVKKYSNFIAHPIRLEGRRVNVQDAIWSQGKAEVSAEQYREFYKFLTHGTEEPLHHLHLTIDAPVQYRAVLFIPSHLTNEVLYSPTGFGLHLYAHKVFIQEDCQELLPLYLRFLRGVVDTEDLPLNVSRELVQKNPLLEKLRTSLTGRVLRELKALADADGKRYGEFWSQYGRVLKEGITSDEPNRERLLELVRFNSSGCAGADELVTLKDYVARMREGQQEILYLSGPSREAIERNPHLEFFRKHGLEVLYLTDHVDDFAMAHLREFEGKPFASADRAELEAFKATPAAPAESGALPEQELEPVLAYFRETLGARVANVVASQRLVESPACLASPDGISHNLEKMMRALHKDFPSAPKILELNPAHPLVQDLARMVAADRGDALLRMLAEQVFENCLLIEGLVEHPERMVERVQNLMAEAARLRVAAGPAAGTVPGTP